MLFQTENFAVKLGKKKGQYYVALQRKSDKETLIEFFPSKKKAEAKYFDLTKVK